jgi:hypothetical protein
MFDLCDLLETPIFHLDETLFRSDYTKRQLENVKS